MIKEIKLKNFKVFEEESFNIKPLTLITGVNGMGKSTLIQSLLFLKQNYELGYLSNPHKKLRLKHDFVNLESAGDICYTFAEEKNVCISIKEDDGNEYQWILDTSETGSEEIYYTYTGNDIHELSLFDDRFIFLEADRWGPKAQYNKSEARAYNTSLGIQGELTPAYLNNALSINEEIGIKEMKHSTLNDDQIQLTENVNAWMAQIMQVPSLKANTTEIDKDKIRLEYGMAGTKGKKYSALQVGFGFTYCLPIIVALLRAKVNDLLIFENPEAHLHPSAQVELGKLIALTASKGVQIIIESHSDHILNSLRLARKEKTISQDDLNVIFVQRDFGSDDDMEITYIDEIQITDEGKLSIRPKNFFDSWDDVLTRLIE
mgnify:CR=1 FL=1